jgi:3-hydroxyisobutyrate dehydrogenase
MNVTVLGTGIMGAPMARNIKAAGHTVRAWNRSIDKARPLAEDGVEVVEDARAAVEGAEVVVTMLADASAVHAVLVDAGALDAMDDGAVLCQMSTIGIVGIEDVAKLCAERGIPLVDAPVSGTRQPAEQGKLTVIAAGPADAVERCEPIFDAVGASTIRLGEAGEATRLKLVLNHWLLALVDSLAETIDFAQGIDVDPTMFLKAISGGPLGPAYADLKGGAMIEGNFDPPAFPLHLAGKDADLVAEAAQRHELELELIPVIRERIGRAVDAGHGEEDMAAIFRG